MFVLKCHEDCVSQPVPADPGTGSKVTRKAAALGYLASRMSTTPCKLIWEEVHKVYQQKKKRRKCTARVKTIDCPKNFAQQ